METQRMEEISQQFRIGAFNSNWQTWYKFGVNTKF